MDSHPPPLSPPPPPPLPPPPRTVLFRAVLCVRCALPFVRRDGGAASAKLNMAPHVDARSDRRWRDRVPRDVCAVRRDELNGAASVLPCSAARARRGCAQHAQAHHLARAVACHLPRRRRRAANAGQVPHRCRCHRWEPLLRPRPVEGLLASRIERRAEDLHQRALPPRSLPRCLVSYLDLLRAGTGESAVGLCCGIVLRMRLAFVAYEERQRDPRGYVLNLPSPPFPLSAARSRRSCKTRPTGPRRNSRS